MKSFFENRYFKNNKLATFPAKRRDQIDALKILVGQFRLQRSYTEKEVNAILNNIIATRDPVFFRRELIDLGLLVRDPAGRSYQRKQIDQAIQQL